MTTIYRPLTLAAVVLGLSACSHWGCPENEVHTLYSTNFPHDVGRHPVATFDVAAVPELSLSICQETAELYKADFEKRKRENARNANWANAEARYWCEKGRFKK
jgi:hypothetical protein